MGVTCRTYVGFGYASDITCEEINQVLKYPCYERVRYKVEETIRGVYTGVHGGVENSKPFICLGLEQIKDAECGTVKDLDIVIPSSVDIELLKAGAKILGISTENPPTWFMVTHWG
jgi:hypothetical protein